jgi:hypothetical protein
MGENAACGGAAIPVVSVINPTKGDSMTFPKRLAGAAALGAALLLGSGPIASPAQAGYVVTLEEVSGDVVATGSGALDLDGLSPFLGALPRSRLNPSSALLITGPTDPTPADSYRGITGPASFGSGGDRVADSGSGDIVSVDGTFGRILVPDGYDFGDSLSSTATYLGTSFGALGVTPGTYVWSWGDGPDQNFTLIINAVPVPEPASAALLGAALAGLLLTGTVRRWPQA